MTRRLVTTFVACLVLLCPASAAAAPNFSMSALTMSGTPTAGEVVTYSLTLTNGGDATGAATNNGISFAALDFVPGWTLVDTTVTGPNAAHVLPVAASTVTNVLQSFPNGSATISWKVRLPFRFLGGFRMRATGTGTNLTGVSSVSEPVNVSKGGPSVLTIKLTPDRTWVPLNTTVGATVSVTNHGSGPALNAVILSSSSPSADGPLAGGAPPTVSSTMTVVPGSGCTSITGARCTLDEIAPGATRTFRIEASGIDRYGRISVHSSLESVADSDQDQVSGGFSASVTNGAVVHPVLRLSGPRTLPVRSDVALAGSIQNLGPDAMTGAVLAVQANTFTAGGARVRGTSVLATSPIRQVTINGAAVTCTPTSFGGRPDLSELLCPVPAIAVGARVAVGLLVNVPSPLPDTYPGISMSLHTPAYQRDTSSSYAYLGAVFNPSSTYNLAIRATSPGKVGTDRVVTQHATITNTGTVPAGYHVYGRVLGGGSILAERLPDLCELVETILVRCHVLELAPGASAQLPLAVRAPGARGQLTVVWSLGQGESFDRDGSDDVDVRTVQVVRPSEVPLGAKVTRWKAQPARRLATAGVVTVARCPNACRATVKLTIPRAQARRIGLRLPKRGDVTLASATKRRGAAGALRVKVKIAKAHRAKLRRWKRTVLVTRTTSVVSTASDNRGASTTAIQRVKLTRWR